MRQLVSIFGLMVLAAAALGDATTRPVLEVADAGGVVRRPLEIDGKKGIAWIFLSHDCPICNGYAPELGRIYAEYSQRGIMIYLVNVEKEFSNEDARKHAAEYSLPTTVLMDRRHELVKFAGANVTPEAVVFGVDGKMVYRGRIDDRYPQLGKERLKATSSDLREALDRLVDGKGGELVTTKAVGCAISD